MFSPGTFEYACHLRLFLLKHLLPVSLFTGAAVIRDASVEKLPFGVFIKLNLTCDEVWKKKKTKNNRF